MPAAAGAAAPRPAPAAARRRRAARPPARPAPSSARLPEERERDVERRPAPAAARPPDRRPRRGSAPAPPPRAPAASSATNSRSSSSASRRRSRCITTVVVRSRTIARSPGSCTVRSSRPPPASATLRQTIPTGFSGVPPPGPATPVMPTPTAAPKRAAAPSASAAATSGETAPWRSISSAGTSGERDLRGVGVGDDAAEHVGARSRAVGQAAGHQPAGARLGDRDRAPARAARATCASIVAPSSENSVSPWRARIPSTNAS